MQGSLITTRSGRRRNSPWFRDSFRIKGDLPYPEAVRKRWPLSEPDLPIPIRNRKVLAQRRRGAVAYSTWLWGG